jgi:hypothetical protein
MFNTCLHLGRSTQSVNNGHSNIYITNWLQPFHYFQYVHIIKRSYKYQPVIKLQPHSSTETISNGQFLNSSEVKHISYSGLVYYSHISCTLVHRKHHCGSMHIPIHISLERYEDFCWLYYYDLLKNLQYRQGLTTESSVILKGSKRLLQFRKKMKLKAHD